jgi:uracil-DNA glycosylase
MLVLKNDWGNLLQGEFEKNYFLQIKQHLREEYATNTIFPSEDDIFNALHYTSYEQTKVVILGQDPYHGMGQAHGLSFSVKRGVKIPPSLKNIFKELEADLGYPIANHGCLETWADQGVLLLNTVLTVKASTPNSHKGIGWEYFTDHIISLLNQREKPVIFILWGRNAGQKKQLITAKQHLVIEAPHPSPFSANRGFFGSRPFSKANQFLKSVGDTEINWEIKKSNDT